MLNLHSCYFCIAIYVKLRFLQNRSKITLCMVIRVPESGKFLLLESGMQNFEIQTLALRIEIPISIGNSIWHKYHIPRQISRTNHATIRYARNTCIAEPRGARRKEGGIKCERWKGGRELV